MVKLQGSQKHSQEEIFTSYSWWDQGNLLHAITAERCDYIESCVDRVFGREALRQEGALRAARDHTRRSGLGQTTYFEQGYAESLPYADGSFSVIVCLDVLEHVQDLDATTKEIARVLAPGGVFIFDTINRTILSRIALIWVGERFFQKSGLVPGLHSYQGFIKPGELQAVITEHSLKVHEMIGFMPKLKRGRLTLGPGWFRGVSYVGYATKDR